jgi:hypothetical protein
LPRSLHLLETIVDELSDAERKAIAETNQCLKNHDPTQHEEGLAEFGLTLADESLPRNG